MILFIFHLAIDTAGVGFFTPQSVITALIVIGFWIGHFWKEGVDKDDLNLKMLFGFLIVSWVMWWVVGFACVFVFRIYEIVFG